jgi:hypothetical protein
LIKGEITMKKSDIYKMAQIAVLGSNNISPGMKLDIIRELMEKEDVALFTEERAEEEGKDNA